MSNLIIFFLNNHITIIAAMVTFIFTWSLYIEYFTINETSDDWWEVYSFKILANKYGSRHYEFVGQPIKINEDISMIYDDGENGHIRVFKGES